MCDEDNLDRLDSGEYEASVADSAELEASAVESGALLIPFRAIDLVTSEHSFHRFTRQSSTACAAEGSTEQDGAEPSFGDAPTQGLAKHSELGPYDSLPFEPVGSESAVQSDFHDVATEVSVELVDEPEQGQQEPADVLSSTGPSVSQSAWSEMVASSFGQFRQLDDMLRFPWEKGILADIFDFQQDPLPTCPGIPERDVSSGAGTSTDLQVQVQRFQMPREAKYTHAVKSLQDMTYFESKTQKLDLACAQWLNILSLEWSASGVGPQIVTALQRDATGADAITILKSCFGVKSPSTLLKRAGAFRKYISWFDKIGMGGDIHLRPLPLDEEMVWQYFGWLRQQRQIAVKGFTIPGSFLEAVRFTKFTLDLIGTDAILGSKRLLGFAALEKQAMCPSRQAPGMEVEHIRKLHDILASNANIIDRLGAVCFLICVYGRARWSDLRFIEKAEIEENECITFYTTEHKTAAVGLRRQQFLPLVVPWEGVVTEDWLQTFLKVYAQVGLDINRRPLGPLLPAPRLDGSFCARPLSTSEAADWLRALLHGTKQSESFRSHSMKATLLGWCARAGLDKECRAVLGHHCSALNGSEVIYSRQLQIRALRKLGHILRRVRSGLSLEDEAMREFGLIRTPMPATPTCAARTPLGPTAVTVAVSHQPAQTQGMDAVTEAVQAAVAMEEQQSVKEEELDSSLVESAADKLTLFPVELVAAGVVEIELSSGSDSSSSSTESDSSSTVPVANDSLVRYTEEVLPGQDFFKHCKSGIVHCCKSNELTSRCKLSMGANFKKMDRKFHFKYPKCLRCFPKDSDRIRSVQQMADNLDAFLKEARSSASD